MSSLKFNPQLPNIIVEAKIKGNPNVIALMIVDTGASVVVLPWRLVPKIGIEIDPTKTMKATTASMVETVPEVLIPEMTVLGKTVKNVQAIIKDLPPEAPADGLLGLSFLKHFKLEIDFKKGLFSLE